MGRRRTSSAAPILSASVFATACVKRSAGNGGATSSFRVSVLFYYYRLKSVSYDMAKQTGDWQCGGKTHEDHSAAFDTLFLGRVEDLSSLLQTSAGLKTGEARQMLCQLFQVSSRDACTYVPHTPCARTCNRFHHVLRRLYVRPHNPVNSLIQHFIKLHIGFAEAASILRGTR